MKLLTTSELATLFSISKHTIRHYIDIDLLTPKERGETMVISFSMKKMFIDYIKLSFLGTLATLLKQLKRF